jgi:hypothetical protein
LADSGHRLWLPVRAAQRSGLVGAAPEQWTEGAGLFSLSRNIGSSVGISVVNALLTRNTQVNHAEIVQHVTAVNRAFERPAVIQFWNPLTAAGRAALDAMITRQAQIIAYIDRDAPRDPAAHRVQESARQRRFRSYARRGIEMSGWTPGRFTIDTALRTLPRNDQRGL